MKINIGINLLYAIVFLSSCNFNPTNVEENKKYFIGLHATKYLQNKNFTGHMFVEYYVTVNGKKQTEGKFGFNPKTPPGYTITDWLQNKVIEGEFGYEDLDLVGDSKFEKEVSADLYLKAMNVKKSWSNSSVPYQAGKTDCITYAMDVAKSINTKIPVRGSRDFPIDLLNKYIELNK